MTELTHVNFEHIYYITLLLRAESLNVGFALFFTDSSKILNKKSAKK